MMLTFFRTALLSMLAIGITAAAQPDDKQASMPILPANQWRVTSSTGDNVKLSEKSGILAVQYEVSIDKSRRSGHITQKEGAFTLELAKPLALTPTQARILFETRTPETAEGLLVVRPLIEDAKGERLSYEPLAMRTFKAPEKGQWSAWRTHVFNMTEAGGAAQGIYEAEGGDLNAWPDGPLKFVGFQVRVYADKGKRTEGKGKKTGTVLIGDISTGEPRLKDEPFTYADTLFKAKGTYRLGFETRAAFQGIPIEEKTETIEFDPADEASQRRRIAFPLNALHNSWVRYRATDASGKIVTDGSFRWELGVAPTAEKELVPVSETKAPVIGLVRIDPDRDRNPRKARGVFKDSEPAELKFRIFSPAAASGAASPKKLKWTLASYAFDKALTEGTVDIQTKGGDEFSDVTVKLPLQQDRDAYNVRYEILDSENIAIDSGKYVVGISRPAVLPNLTRTGTLPDRNKIKKFPYFRTTVMEKRDKNATEESCLKDVQNALEESRQMADHITYPVDLADLEILPGVYDFRLLDQALDTAADNGYGVTIRLAHTERDCPYRWQPYTTPRSFDGTALVGHGYYGSFSMSDPEFVDGWRRAFRAVYQRYAQHRAFEGYYIMHAGGEWAIPDEPWNGYIADYSWSSALAFRNWLKDERKLDLTALNTRWGTSYTSWDQVALPQPDLEKGIVPDLRPQWVDFNRFKIWMRGTWFVNMSRAIRAYDKDRVIITYGFREAGPEILSLVDYFHNGGNHFLLGEGTLIEPWEKDHVGWITEPHHPHRWAAYGDPADRGWVLDWSVYVMTAQAGAGGANLHVYYMPNPTISLAAHYGTEFAYDRYEMFKPILRELHGIKLQEVPKQIAVIQDMDTLMTKHRTVFSARLDDLNRFFDLLKQDSLDYEKWQQKNEAAYKLLVLNPLDEVLSQDTIDTAKRMAQNGSWVVMSARSGHYSSDRPTEQYPLLRALGITPPAGAYEVNRAGIAATLVPGKELVAGQKALPFFTQADFAKDLQDPGIGKDFFRWPYRWIPQSDYFGYYADNKNVGGEVLATFPDGGTALSLHTVGKGKVLVFWGTPDIALEKTKGLLAAIAKQAGVTNPREGSPIPLMMEAERKDLGRRYTFLFKEEAGEYTQKMPNLPDGEWFADDMVGGLRLGVVDGKTVREKGMQVRFDSAASPLKILRFIPKAAMKTRWVDKYQPSN